MSLSDRNSRSLGLVTPEEGNAAEANGHRRRSNATRAKILEAAYEEFASYGFAGARVDRINNRAGVNPRMIYHLFGSKEQLYHAVLVAAYSDIREKETALDIEHLGSIDGILALFEFTFDYFRDNPSFIWLLTNENLMRGKFVLSSNSVTEMTWPLRSSLERLVRQGVTTGVLPPEADPLQIYATIASLSWFHLSNGYTLSAMFGRDLTATKWRASRKEVARDTLLAYLRSGKTPKSVGDGKRRRSAAPRQSSK